MDWLQKQLSPLDKESTMFGKRHYLDEVFAQLTGAFAARVTRRSLLGNVSRYMLILTGYNILPVLPVRRAYADGCCDPIDPDGVCEDPEACGMTGTPCDQCSGAGIYWSGCNPPDCCDPDSVPITCPVDPNGNVTISQCGSWNACCFQDYDEHGNCTGQVVIYCDCCSDVVKNDYSFNGDFPNCPTWCCNEPNCNNPLGGSPAMQNESYCSGDQPEYWCTYISQPTNAPCSC